MGAKVKAEYEILYDQNFRDLIPKCDIFLDEIEKHIVVDDDMKDKRKKLVFVKILRVTKILRSDLCWRKKSWEINWLTKQLKLSLVFAMKKTFQSWTYQRLCKILHWRNWSIK